MPGRLPRLSLTALPFSEKAFGDVIRAATGAEPGRSDQIKYLSSYLANPEAGALSMVVETPYIDRHYLEEFTGYYANTLVPPSSHAVRVHAFRADVTDKDLRSWLEDASSGKYLGTSKRASAKYLGFVGLRPIPSCPIGRTLLAHYPGRQSSRTYAVTNHHVHLAGLDLSVDAVPFQQQEQAVGACATTAIWSSLARVIRADGGRAPTPFAVTNAATHHLVSNRVFPALEGLSLEQIADAVRSFGYSPHVMKPDHDVQTFHLALKCYVKSGIPVVMVVRDKSEHALAVVGIRESDAEHKVPDIVVGDMHGPHVRAKGITRIYVHDDRLGPYARMTWADATGTKLKFLPYGPAFGVLHEQPEVWYAVAPLYPKLRLSATDLISVAGSLWPVLQYLLDTPGDKMWVDLRFMLGGTYLRGLFEDRLLSKERAANLAGSAFLSRYIGVVRFWVGKELAADVVCDTTDINRDAPRFSRVLAVIPFAPKYVAPFAKFIDEEFPLRPLVA